MDPVGLVVSAVGAVGGGLAWAALGVGLGWALHLAVLRARARARSSTR